MTESIAVPIDQLRGFMEVAARTARQHGDAFGLAPCVRYFDGLLNAPRTAPVPSAKSSGTPYTTAELIAECIERLDKAQSETTATTGRGNFNVSHALHGLRYAARFVERWDDEEKREAKAKVAAGVSP